MHSTTVAVDLAKNVFELALADNRAREMVIFLRAARSRFSPPGCEDPAPATGPIQHGARSMRAVRLPCLLLDQLCQLDRGSCNRRHRRGIHLA